MRLFQLNVTKTKANAGAPIKIPMGIIGAEMVIRFSHEWDGLTKTVVFRAGDVTKDVLNVQDTVVIPVECTQVVGTALDVGVYGTDADDLVAIPTLWATLGTVYDATDPSGDTSTEPTLPVWAQLLAMLDELSKLQGTDGATFIPAVSNDGVLSWTNDKGLENPEPVNIKGKDGKNGIDGYTPVKGKDYFDGKDGSDGKDGYTPIKGVDYFDGKDGAAGEDGRTPEKGVDYFTVADKTEIVNEVLDAIPTEKYGTVPLFEITTEEAVNYMLFDTKADGTKIRLKAALVKIKTTVQASTAIEVYTYYNYTDMISTWMGNPAANAGAYAEYYIARGTWRSLWGNMGTNLGAGVTFNTGYKYMPTSVENFPVIDRIRVNNIPAGTTISIYGVEENA